MILSVLASLSLQAPVPQSPLVNIVLPTIQGEETVDLASFRGKRVLLLQFASW